MTLPRYTLNASDITFLITQEEHDLIEYVISVRGSGWVQDIFDSWTAARRKQLLEDRKKALIEAFDAAATEDQDTIESLLGIDI